MYHVAKLAKSPGNAFWGYWFRERFPVAEREERFESCVEACRGLKMLGSIVSVACADFAKKRRFRLQKAGGVA